MTGTTTMTDEEWSGEVHRVALTRPAQGMIGTRAYCLTCDEPITTVPVSFSRATAIRQAEVHARRTTGGEIRVEVDE